MRKFKNNKAALTSIVDAIATLGADPRPHGSKKLTGSEAIRIRVGNYRIVYELDDEKKTVTIFKVGDRKDVYQ